MIDEQHNRTFKLYGDVEIPVYQQANGNQLVAPYLLQDRRGLHILIAHAHRKNLEKRGLPERRPRFFRLLHGFCQPSRSRP